LRCDALDPAFPALRAGLALWPQLYLNPAYSDAVSGHSALQENKFDVTIEQVPETMPNPVSVPVPMHFSSFSRPLAIYFFVIAD
jgi:hypothetical protein